ncbi:MAG: hypothetical protein COY58_00575 [Gammaproteobacteria bacterium CG_4_10_14_0_8_um_filter_38_16]|nr:MAG: hypothetical protein COY58_00575 [Gammaproteobacteria bacterium CG_4_10_14_0_8_um_filter_38_16]PJA04253.1 MAG: hypothetical protein COX72_01375 [Gammaproteobacteria bacterium CG_4_10_14_0_2_um_filter_38_22]PJB10919.1 MAG: hypothetical protein CO120_02250 [Gammaproteobacteria bacterium CG_4_9_14_3_um_filter_38_9]
MPTTRNIIEQSAEHDLLIHNLRALMKKAGLNEAELSRRTNIPQATVHKILAGKTEDPRASTLKTLSDFFDISIDELLSGNPTAAGNKSPAITVQSIPVISWKDCTNAVAFISHLTPGNWNKWMVSEFLSKNAYALSSKPSMGPRFPKDTILFIDPDATPEDGDYVIVLYSGTDEATIREFSIDGPIRLLLPLNPNAEPTKLDDYVKILGVLVKTTFSY